MGRLSAVFAWVFLGCVAERPFAADAGSGGDVSAGAAPSPEASPCEGLDACLAACVSGRGEARARCVGACAGACPGASDAAPAPRPNPEPETPQPNPEPEGGAGPCPDICGTLNGLCGAGPAGVDWYFAGGRRVELGADAHHVLIQTPSGPPLQDIDLPGVLAVLRTPALARRGLALVRVTEARPALLKALRGHPSVEGAYRVWRDAAGRRVLATDRIVVRPVELTDRRIKTLFGRHGLQAVRPLEGLDGVWMVRAPRGDAFAAARALVRDPDVRWAHPNFLRGRSLHRIPDDPLFGLQWHHRNLGERGAAEGIDLRTWQAWDLEFGVPQVRIGVFDDGIDHRHPDLRVAVDDMADGEPLLISPPDSLTRALNEGCCRHGTAVAGVAVATGDNDEGLVGVCPGCSVLPIFTEAGWDESAVMAERLVAAMHAGAAVINNSWGPYDGHVGFLDGQGGPTPVLDDVRLEALETLADEGRGGRGVVVVFSAGNGNEPIDNNPLATHPTVIAVGAVDDSGHKARYSDFGDALWVVAPSDGGRTSGIWTTDAQGLDWGFNDRQSPVGWGDDVGDYLAVFGGTSAAAPAISGLVGLMISANPELTSVQIKDILRRTARPIDLEHGRYEEDAQGRLRSPFYGYGLADARAAVEAAMGQEPQTPELPVALPPREADPEGEDCMPEVGCGDPTLVCLQRVDRWGDPTGVHGCAEGTDDGCLAFCVDAWRDQPDLVEFVRACMARARTCEAAEGCLQ